jgi:hypothetical protein
MAELNPREEIVGLLRGYFACPLITALGKRGVFSRFLEGDFRVGDFPEIVDGKLFQYVLNYFVSLGLLDVDDGVYNPTELGAKIFKRYGSFVLLHSYRDLIEHMDALLFVEGSDQPRCDRLDNVIGSGLTNGRKFFPKAIDMLATVNPACITDVACGDGEFLKRVVNRFPDIDVIASDLSEVAISQTVKNLNTLYPDKSVVPVQTDALDVSKWASIAAEHAENAAGDMVISMWYLIHEISRHDENVIVDFLRRIHEECPRAHLIIGEIVSIPNHILVKNRHGSIMPEFLLFHDISGQGVLTWQQFQTILTKIPYVLEHEAKFDLVEDDGEEFPTGIVWHLKPKG